MSYTKNINELHHTHESAIEEEVKQKKVKQHTHVHTRTRIHIHNQKKSHTCMSGTSQRETKTVM